MLYRLCNKDKGLLMTREPIVPDEILNIEFDGVESGYTAVLMQGEKSLYRPITNGTCEVETSALVPGELKLTVINDEHSEPRYACDEMYVVKRDNVTVVLANMLEYDRLLVELRAEAEEQRVELEGFRVELERFRTEFDRIYAGYAVL